MEETYQDSLKLGTSAESVENDYEKESGKDISKPVEDDKASTEVKVSDTDWTSPDKDLNGDNMLNSEIATTCENDQTKSNSTSLHNAQDQSVCRLKVDQ